MKKLAIIATLPLLLACYAMPMVATGREAVQPTPTAYPTASQTPTAYPAGQVTSAAIDTGAATGDAVDITKPTPAASPYGPPPSFEPTNDNVIPIGGHK